MQSNRKREDTKKWLQWVLEFTQTDLESLSRSRRYNLMDKLVYFTSPNFLHARPIFGDFTYYKDYYFPPPKHRTTQQKERFALAESALAKIQQDLSSMLQSLQDIISTGRRGSVKDYELCESLGMLSIVDYIPWEKDKFQIRFKPKEDNDLVAWAKTHFAELLGGLPVHVIKRCKGCSAYFLNLTQREKDYCNSACASRSGQQRRREEIKKDPDRYEAYLEEARAPYWKKKRAEFPNIRIPPRRRRVELKGAGAASRA